MTQPPGALVGLYPKPSRTTVAPGVLHLRASKDYTVRAALRGYEITYAAIPAAPGFPWPWPINMIIQWSGGYDSTVTIALPPCTDTASCNEDEERIRLPLRRR